MPPCGDTQQFVCISVAGLLDAWSQLHPEFAVGGNEAGMILGAEVRGADAAVWRRRDLPQRSGGYQRVPPVLAVEVAGLDEDEAELREKARWYLAHGVGVVWLVLPETREVIVIRPGAETRARRGERLPPHPDLPGLEPEVDRFFRQLDPA